MSDINDPPWVVEIDGIKFATPEAVVILLQSVSEERDELEAELRQANIAIEEYQDWLKKAEARVQRLTEALETIAGNGLTLDKRKYDADDAVLMRKCARFALKEKKDA